MVGGINVWKQSSTPGTGDSASVGAQPRTTGQIGGMRVSAPASPPQPPVQGLGSAAARWAGSSPLAGASTLKGIVQVSTAALTQQGLKDLVKSDFKVVKLDAPRVDPNRPDAKANEGAPWRQGELKDSDAVIRTAVLSTYKVRLDKLKAEVQKRSPEEALDYNNIINDGKKLTKALFGDGSDEALNKIVDSLGDECVTLMAARRLGVDAAGLDDVNAAKARNVLSSSETTLRSTSKEIAGRNDSPALLQLSKFGQQAATNAGNSKIQSSSNPIPDKLLPAYDATKAEYFRCTNRLGELIEQRGRAAAQALLDG